MARYKLPYNVTSLLKYSGRIGYRKSKHFMRKFTERFRNIASAYITDGKVDGALYPIVFRALSKSGDAKGVERLIKDFKTLYNGKYVTIEKVQILVSE